jgi:hypothetical protein
MYRRDVRDALERAAEAVEGSHIAQQHARQVVEGWRVWRTLRGTLERQPPAERMLPVCMYCGRVRYTTGEWVRTPPLTEMLPDPRLIQVTHGACPICFAGHLPDQSQ